MDERHALAGLMSLAPSHRMRAALWFNSSATREHLEALSRAAADETVPAIKRLLREVVERTESVTGGAPTDDGIDTDLDAQLVLDDLAGMIKHEMEPAIGWVRSAANREIDGFSSSRTNTEIEKMRRRLNGLISLAEASRPPRFERVTLVELLTECQPPETAQPSIISDPLDNLDSQLETDRGLMNVLLTNVMQNAYEALELVTDDAQVTINCGTTEYSFWINITNRFRGPAFNFEDVAATGVSTKQDQRGLGMTIVRMAADRLGYEVSLTGAASVATFSVRGARKHG